MAQHFGSKKNGLNKREGIGTGIGLGREAVAQLFALKGKKIE